MGDYDDADSDSDVEIPKNTMIYDYADKYPEDIPKLLDFFESRRLEDAKQKKQIDRVMRQPDNKDRDTEICNLHTTHTHENLTADITTTEEGCLLCRKSWESTKDLPKIELLCNHVYHTACYLNYYEPYGTCAQDGCGINSMRLAQRISEHNKLVNESVTEVLLTRLSDDAEFKKHVKAYKATVRDVSKSIVLYNRSVRVKHKQVIQKHIFSIKQIQEDINESYAGLRDTEEATNCNKAVRKSRAYARKIYEKYHISLRDMRRQGLVRMPWHLRSLLEFHRQLLSPRYRFKIRIIPSNKKWNIEGESDNESESDNV